jgi:hypothetical protein
MMIKIMELTPLTVFISKHEGKLIIEMDNDDKCAVTYHGVDPSTKRGVKINPTLSDDETRLYSIDPPMEAPLNQMRTHRYSIKKQDNCWPPRSQVKYLDVTEHNEEEGLHWTMTLEGIGAIIVMPDDYKACEVVQET